MSFSKSEIDALAAAAPDGSFLGAPAENISEWLAFVASVDDNAKSKHPLIFYGVAGRLLSETVGSLVPDDSADARVRAIFAADNAFLIR